MQNLDTPQTAGHQVSLDTCTKQQSYNRCLHGSKSGSASQYSQRTPQVAFAQASGSPPRLLFVALAMLGRRESHLQTRVQEQVRHVSAHVQIAR